MGKPITTPEELLAAKMELMEALDHGKVTLEEFVTQSDALTNSFTPPAHAMTLKEATAILKKHNVWRRGDENLAMTEPVKLGEAIDIIVNYLEIEDDSP